MGGLKGECVFLASLGVGRGTSQWSWGTLVLRASTWAQLCGFGTVRGFTGWKQEVLGKCGKQREELKESCWLGRKQSQRSDTVGNRDTGLGPGIRPEDRGYHLCPSSTHCP